MPTASNGTGLDGDCVHLAFIGGCAGARHVSVTDGGTGASPPPVPGPSPSWYSDPAQPGMQASPPPKTDGFAIAALVFGIIGGPLFAIIFGFVARRRIKASGGKTGGAGVATAGIILGFAWVALIAISVIVAIAGGSGTDNASHYTGEEAVVAKVADDLYDAFRDKDGVRVCTQLFTSEFAELVGLGSGKTCSQFIAGIEGRQKTITVKRIAITGDTATLEVDEGDDAQEWSLVRQDGRWRVDDIQSQ